MAGVYNRTGSEDNCCYSNDGGTTEQCIMDYHCSGMVIGSKLAATLVSWYILVLSGKKTKIK